MSTINSSRRLTTIAILVSMSMTMFLLETLLPIPFLVPGAKLGLSNIVTIVALYKLSAVDALAVLVIRIFLSVVFVGSPTIILFSFSGGLLSLAFMVLLKYIDKFSIIGVSAAGGFSHNLGQLIVAKFVMSSQQIFNYLPALGICGVFTGIIIGLIADNTIKRLKFLELNQ